MRIISQKELQDILAKHKKWLNGKGGERAYLCYAYLQGFDLRGADLQEADLRGADLQEADLRGADLWKANLSGVNLQNTKLWKTILYNANVGYVKRRWFVYTGAIGSRNAETLYFADCDNVRCGCWRSYRGGTLAEFKEHIDKVYPANDKKHFMYRLGYLAAIKMFSLIREAYVKSAAEAERRKCY